MQTRRHSIGIRKAFLAWLLTSAICESATLTIQGTEQDSLNLHIDPDPLSYFYLKQSTDLVNFTPFSMVLGNQETIWPLSSEDVPTRFFSVTKISLFAPEDTDGDGIDDVYELRHRILNPLDATDALLRSGNGNLTFLQEYRSSFGFEGDPPEVIGREVSAFNFGTQIDAAISRELGVFNFGRAYDNAISREVAVFNLGSPLHAIDAISREIAVFNGGSGPPSYPGEVYSREISSFNFGAALAATDVRSREVSIFNGDRIPSSGLREVHSRELTIFNLDPATRQTEAISRELSVLNNAL